MKKSIILILLLVFGMSFSSAVQCDTSLAYGGNEEECAEDPLIKKNATGQNTENTTSDEEGHRIGNRMMAQAGTYVGPQGQQMNIQRLNNRVQLRVGNFSADCDCNLTQEQVQNRTKLYAGLSNGRNAEIKIMPDVASETALQRLRLKNCDGNCSIELKEVGQGNTTRLAYEINTQKQAKFLGLFKTQMQVQAQVDSETGEIIKVNKPWWSFLASEEDEE